MTIDIGSRIKSARKEKGITQKALAKELGKSERMIQKYENNEVEPSFSIVEEISKILDTNIDYLLISKKIDAIDEALNEVDFDKIQSEIRNKSKEIRRKLTSNDDFCLYDIDRYLYSTVVDIITMAGPSKSLNYSLDDFSVEELDELGVFIFNSYQLKVNEILERHKNKK